MSGLDAKKKLYAVWSGAKSRCHNPNHPGWPNYGGRGIYMCDEWRASFERFASDVGYPQWPHLQLDRIDNDGPYAPGNVRWASARVQSNNRRTKPKRHWQTVGMFATEHEAFKQIAEAKGVHVARLLEEICREWLDARADEPEKGQVIRELVALGLQRRKPTK